MILSFSLAVKLLDAQQLYELPQNTESWWVSFENRSGSKGRGGRENKTAKGHPSEWIQSGERVTLLDFNGAGVINRIWMTIIDRNPVALRSIYIEMYWDNASKPAVSVPLGDFFGVGQGRMVAFENVFFSDPEGKSFNCYIPMPFKKHARVVLVNQSKQRQLLFYDIDLSKWKKPPRDMAYFHAYWSTNRNSKLGEDFRILPKVKGKGRFLGANISVITDKIYEDTWFGEGEVKVYLDGDHDFPTLVGSGTEDYIGSAWNLNAFSNLYQGAPIVDKKNGEFSFYRYHVPDPIFFKSDCSVTIQQMGGAGRDVLRKISNNGGRLKPVSVMADTGLIQLLDQSSYPDLFDDRFSSDGWVNFYRVDHYSATAYFYLDKPESELPALAPLSVRLAHVRP